MVNGMEKSIKNSIFFIVSPHKCVSEKYIFLMNIFFFFNFANVDI